MSGNKRKRVVKAKTSKRLVVLNSRRRLSKPEDGPWLVLIRVRAKSRPDMPGMIEVDLPFFFRSRDDAGDFLAASLPGRNVTEAVMYYKRGGTWLFRGMNDGSAS